MDIVHTATKALEQAQTSSKNSAVFQASGALKTVKKALEDAGLVFTSLQVVPGGKFRIFI